MSFKTRLSLLYCGLCLSLLMGVSSPAQANITPTLDSISAFGADYLWEYELQVDNAQDVYSGNFFTIYDFAGFTGTTFEPNADWTFSSSLLGLDPANVLPADDGGIPNLTWTYNGQSPLIGPQVIGKFGAVSDRNYISNDNFAGRATNKVDLSGISNIGDVQVPTPTPEPTSMALLGAGCLGLIAKRRRKA